MYLFKTIVQSSITAGNALIDSTTANAFAAPVGIDFTPYRGSRIEFWSGSTLWASAWVSGTAPGGESLSADILSGWDFTSGWTAGATTTIVDSNTFSANSGVATVRKQGGLSVMSLYKCVYSIPAALVYPVVFDEIVTTYFEFRSSGKYQTVPGSYGNAYNGIRSNTSPITVDVNQYELYQVLSPASTGALLLSSPGGSRGWEYKHASFDPNSALTLRIMSAMRV